MEVAFSWPIQSALYGLISKPSRVLHYAIFIPELATGAFWKCRPLVQGVGKLFWQRLSYTLYVSTLYYYLT